MKKRNVSKLIIAITLLGSIGPVAAQAQPQQDPPPPYNRLDLTSQQARQITVLDREWKRNYSQIEPRLTGEQRKLRSMLSTPKADPLEITSTQEHINRLKEQLTGSATSNYLKKRRVLTPGQQREVQNWMRRELVNKYSD